MNILSRLLKVLHWIIFIYTSFTILFVLVNILAGEHVGDILSQVLQGMFLIENADSLYMGVPIDLSIIIPFIRYIIFGRIGWFPWTPFRKE